MAQKGQRQDVAFLALAVAVLAVGVALFVGLRAFPRRPPQEPKAPPVARPTPPLRLATKPSQPPGHDPFGSRPIKPPEPPPQAKPKPAEELKLVGIVRGKELLAVIRYGDRRYYSRQGARIAGYTLAEIGSQRVVLTKGEERLALSLRPPQTGATVRESD